MTKGSVFRLYDSHNPSRSDLPELEIVDVAAFTSHARIRTGSFGVGDLVSEVTHAYSFRPIRLYVAGTFADGLDADLVRRVQTVIRRLPGFELVTEPVDADLTAHVLRPQRSDGKHIVREGRLPRSSPDETPELWVVSEHGELLHEQMRIPLANADTGMRLLEINLSAFAWLREVKQLRAPRHTRPVAVRAFVLRNDPACANACVYLPKDLHKERPYSKLGPYELTDASMQVRRGDLLMFSFKNMDAKRAWFTYLLNLSPDGKVLRIYPTRHDNEEEARLRPEEQRDLGMARMLRLNQEGIETVKLIVASSPVDVRFLENDQGFTARERPTRSLNALEQLLQGAARRRDGSSAIDDWGTLQADFEVLAEGGSR
jgi:hypothetical protein